MMKLLLSTSMDAVLEATRVLGNLSQSKDVRSVIVQNKGETDTHTLCLAGVAIQESDMSLLLRPDSGKYSEQPCKLLPHV